MISRFIDNTTLVLSLYDSQCLHDFWNHTTLERRLQEASLYSPGGSKVIVMPWCESLHFFGIAGVIGDLFDTICVMESIGGYAPPQGVAVMKDFMEVCKMI